MEKAIIVRNIPHFAASWRSAAGQSGEEDCAAGDGILAASRRRKMQVKMVSPAISAMKPDSGARDASPIANRSSPEFFVRGERRLARVQVQSAAPTPMRSVATKKRKCSCVLREGLFLMKRQTMSSRSKK